MSNQLNFRLRPYTSTDAHQVVFLINTAALQTVGFKQAVVDGVGNVRLSRYTPPTSEKVVVTNAQNEIVGFAYCINGEQGIIGQMGGAVHPDYWGKGIGSSLVNWAEDRAIAFTKNVPSDIRTVLQTNLYANEHEAIRLFTAHGFMKVREWAHLVVELDSPPSVPNLPDGLVIRAMDLDHDWDIVGPSMDDAYADHWGTIPDEIIEAVVQAQTADEEEDDKEEGDELPEDESYSNGPGRCFIALDGQTVVGGVLCNGKLVERDDTGRIGSLFVRPRYRRQGVARALMLTAFNAFWAAGIVTMQTPEPVEGGRFRQAQPTGGAEQLPGIKRMITDTDAESFTDAPKFYRSLGMQLYRREYLYEKEIRPGREVRRLEP